MNRTDIHSPKHLITEDYEYVGSGDFGGPGELGHNPLGPNGSVHYLLDEGWAFGENHSAGSCYHCGASLRYYAILKHNPTHTLVRVGETCLMNRFDRATEDFHRLRKQAELDRKQQRIKKLREAWAEAHPTEYVFLTDEGQTRGNGFYESLARSLQNYGELTERQLAAIEKAMVEQPARDAKRLAEDEVEAYLMDSATPVPEGKLTITGEILSTRVKDYGYGYDSRHVMTLRDDRGFKVWGTVPSRIFRLLDELPTDDPRNDGEGLRGLRVRFDATVSRSPDDETFGFYSRPTKVALPEEVTA